LPPHADSASEQATASRITWILDFFVIVRLT
jgi:hypothetical protein